MILELVWKDGRTQRLEVPDLPPEVADLPSLDVRRLGAEVARLEAAIGLDGMRRLASWTEAAR